MSKLPRAIDDRPVLDADLQELLAEMRRYRTFVAAVRWIRWALAPSKSRFANARHLKHLFEWDFALTHDIDHAAFQAAMTAAGYSGTPVVRDDCEYRVSLSREYKRTHRDNRLLQDLPWGWSWLADALSADPGTSRR
jgi:hypothetical protein